MCHGCFQMKQFGTKLADRMALSKAVKGVWPFRLLVGSNETLGFNWIAWCFFSVWVPFIKSLHSVHLRIRRNADTLGSVTSIKMGVESTIFMKARKSCSDCIYRTYQYLLYSILKALNPMLYINTHNYSSAQKLLLLMRIFETTVFFIYFHIWN